MQLSNYSAQHFLWSVDGAVGRVVLNRPERKNPLTFESYAELRDLFRNLVADRSIKTIVVSGAGENFCSGGDVHEIIGPLTKMDMTGLLAFTRKARRSAPSDSRTTRPSSSRESVRPVTLPPVTMSLLDSSLIRSPCGERSSCAIRSKRGSVVPKRVCKRRRTRLSTRLVQAYNRSHSRSAW